MTTNADPKQGTGASIKAALRKVHPAAAPAPSAAATSTPVRARPARPPKRQPPLAPLDVLPRIPLLASRAETTYFFPGPDREVPTIRAIPKRVTPGRRAARGWRAILDRFEALGYVAARTPDGTRATLMSPGGRGGIEAAYAWERVAPLVIAGMNGAPLTCPWCGLEAETMLAGQVPHCGQCTPVSWQTS